MLSTTSRNIFSGLLPEVVKVTRRAQLLAESNQPTLSKATRLNLFVFRTRIALRQM